jgi:hypothetical protein
MQTFTLFMILWLSNGGVAVVESLTFKTETSCKQAALYLENTPREGVRKTVAACKRHTHT